VSGQVNGGVIPEDDAAAILRYLHAAGQPERLRQVPAETLRAARSGQRALASVFVLVDMERAAVDRAGLPVARGRPAATAARGLFARLIAAVLVTGFMVDFMVDFMADFVTDLLADFLADGLSGRRLSLLCADPR
jgi:hypothetical protein